MCGCDKKVAYVAPKHTYVAHVTTATKPGCLPVITANVSCAECAVAPSGSKCTPCAKTCVLPPCAKVYPYNNCCFSE